MKVADWGEAVKMTEGNDKIEQELLGGIGTKLYSAPELEANWPDDSKKIK